MSQLPTCVRCGEFTVLTDEAGQPACITHGGDLTSATSGKRPYDSEAAFVEGYYREHMTQTLENNEATNALMWARIATRKLVGTVLAWSFLLACAWSVYLMVRWA